VEPGRLIGVGPLALSAGGCVGNTGPALASLGVPTQLVADAGSDELGRVLVSLLGTSAADSSGIARLDGLGTSYSIVVDLEGRDRTFWHHIGANAAFDGSGVVERIQAEARLRGALADDREVILHLGYPTHLPALYADGGAVLLRLVAAARSAGATISIDTAEIDPASEAAAAEWESLLSRALPEIDVMKASVDDLRSMMAGRRGIGPVAWADALLDLGAAVALVTAGADGLYLRTAAAARIATAGPALRDAGGGWANRELWVPSMATRVTTTTGAGDAAAAGFLAGLARGFGPAESALLSGAAAAARISGRPIVDADQIASSFELGEARRPGWSLGLDGVFHGPRDTAA
jgi:sugar/nucleoside kinase (ribokinase family)